VELASRSQKSWSAARPLATVSATRDGDIAPGPAQHRATVFDHRTQPSGARSTSTVGGR
jgi:hypothetical protein